ncbi:hypothetical protein MKW98_021462 [Papaver atlanticum]|uniref:Peptidase A1 domain-containing protein n=1 Tax=Papaver atlanticum TaxID=357466 RepID=A0AAD4SRR7_9MAGN|nr:hypothetical protein MKW98_021462 [Papaver atlanticum]
MCFDNPCAQLSGCSRKHGYSTPVVSACTMFVRNGGHTCCHTLMCYCSSSLKYKLFGGLAVPRLYYTKLAIGSPPKDYLLEVDTGSDVSLVNCAQCSPCSPTYTAEDVIVSGKLRTHKPSKLNRR